MTWNLMMDTTAVGPGGKVTTTEVVRTMRHRWLTSTALCWIANRGSRGDESGWIERYRFQRA